MIIKKTYFSKATCLWHKNLALTHPIEVQNQNCYRLKLMIEIGIAGSIFEPKPTNFAKFSVTTTRKDSNSMIS